MILNISPVDNHIYFLSMSSLWNVLAPAISGVVRLSGSGQELFGTVVRHGLINKTITVRVSAQNWNNKYLRYMQSHKNKLVHDELNYCVSGDKVIIKSCKKMSKQKAYYVKNIVKAFGRDEFDRSEPKQEVNQLSDPIIEQGS